MGKHNLLTEQGRADAVSEAWDRGDRERQQREAEAQGNSLRDVRMTLGLTQGEMAKRLDVPLVEYSATECGQSPPSPELIAAINREFLDKKNT